MSVRGRGRGPLPGLLGVPFLDGVTGATPPPPEEDEVRLSQLALEVLADDVAATEPDPVDPPTGGGTIPAGTNPAAGLNLCGTRVPLAWAEITPVGGSTYRYAKQPINIDNAKEPRVESFGRVTRALTNRQGDLRGTTVEGRYIDTDLVLRTLERADSLVGGRLAYYLSTAAAIRAGSTPRRVFDGIITDAGSVEGLLFGIKATDFLQTLLDVVPPLAYPRRVFNTDDFPNLANDPNDTTNPGNPALVGKPVPIGYGLLSDEANDEPIGVVPFHFVGRRYIAYYGSYWDEYVAFCHASAGLQSLFMPIGPNLSTGTDYAARMRITAADPFAEYLFPGRPEWTAAIGADPFVDYNGNRYFSVFAFGPRSDLSRTGIVPLVGNLGGVEDVGDGSGNMIESVALQIAHFIINFVLQSYTSGDWPACPLVGGSYSRLNAASFEAVKLRSEARIAGGHLGAWMLGWDGSTVSLPDLFRMFYRAGVRLGSNKDGQIIGSMIDPTATPVRSITDLGDTLEHTVRDRRRRDEIRNRVVYQFARRYTPPLSNPTPAEGEPLPSTIEQPTTTDWLATGDAYDISDAPSISKYQERRLDLSLELTRDPDTAADLAALQLEVLAPGPVVIGYTEGLCGTNTELGQVTELTHFEGFDERPMQAEVHTLDLDALTVDTEHLDVSEL